MNALTSRWLMGCLAGAIVACRGASLPPPVDVGEEREARALAERWIAQLQGFDGLEAYELRIDERSLGFAVARQHRPGEVRVLAYVVRPRNLDEVALLVRRRSGAPVEVLSYVTPQLYGSGLGARQPGTVMRVPSLSQGLRLGAAAAIAVELVAPFDPGDYRFERLVDAEIAGESCTRLRAIARSIDPAWSELRMSFSKRTGVALERVALSRDGSEAHRIDVRPEDVRQVGERWLPEIQTVRSADGTTAELRLMNVLEDVELPESLFTSRALQLQRFPSF